MGPDLEKLCQEFSDEIQRKHELKCKQHRAAGDDEGSRYVFEDDYELEDVENESD